MAPHIVRGAQWKCCRQAWIARRPRLAPVAPARLLGVFEESGATWLDDLVVRRREVGAFLSGGGPPPPRGALRSIIVPESRPREFWGCRPVFRKFGPQLCRGRLGHAPANTGRNLADIGRLRPDSPDVGHIWLTPTRPCANVDQHRPEFAGLGTLRVDVCQHCAELFNMRANFDQHHEPSARNEYIWPELGRYSANIGQTWL